MILRNPWLFYGAKLFQFKIILFTAWPLCYIRAKHRLVHLTTSFQVFMRHLLPVYYRAVIVMNFTVVMWWCGEGCRRRWHENWCCGCSYFLFWKLSHKSRSSLGWAGLHPSRSNYQQQPGHGRDVIRNSLATANNAHIWCSTQHFRVKTACSSFPCEF